MSAADYHIRIDPLPAEDGGGFVAWIPDLPGCMSDGSTQKEALENARAAIEYPDSLKSREKFLAFFG